MIAVIRPDRVSLLFSFSQGRSTDLLFPSCSLSFFSPTSPTMGLFRRKNTTSTATPPAALPAKRFTLVLPKQESTFAPENVWSNAGAWFPSSRWTIGWRCSEQEALMKSSTRTDQDPTPKDKQTWGTGTWWCVLSRLCIPLSHPWRRKADTRHRFESLQDVLAQRCSGSGFVANWCAVRPPRDFAAFPHLTPLIPGASIIPLGLSWRDAIGVVVLGEFSPLPPPRFAWPEC